MRGIKGMGAAAWAAASGGRGRRAAASEGEVVVAVRPRWRERDRCGVCRRRCPGFDLGEGRRRWRALDLGTTFAFVEADAPQGQLPSSRGGGVRGARGRVTARGSPGRSRIRCAWLAVNCSKTAVAELMRIAWRTVGGILERVAAEAQPRGRPARRACGGSGSTRSATARASGT